MKKNVNVILAAILSVVLLLSMTACGGSVNPNDPNQGLWKAVSGEMLGISMEVSEFFGEGFTLELKDKGKCVIFVDGDKASGTWTLEKGVFTVKGGGIDCAGRLENGILTLDNVLGTGLNLVFEKEGGSSVGTAKPTAISSDAGYYVIESLTQDGSTLDAETLAAIGMNYYILLNEDGTMVFCSDELTKGTWTTGRINYKQDGEDVYNEYMLEVDTLTIEIGDGAATLVYTLSQLFQAGRASRNFGIQYQAVKL